MRIKVKGKNLNIVVKNLNIYNVLASLAVLKTLGLNLKNIANNFKNYEPAEGRGKTHNIKRYNKKFKLIDESYNANPSSVRNAINSFNLIKNKKIKKYLILGDMLELGSKSEMYHKNLSKVINSSDIDKVFIENPIHDAGLFTRQHKLNWKYFQKKQAGLLFSDKKFFLDDMK